MSQVDNLVGQKFNKWTVTKELMGGYIECVCECGTVKVLNKSSVKSGKSKSCGCTKRFKSLKGQTFNYWTVIEDEDAHYALCRCKCGTIKRVQKAHLKNGSSFSCGCINKGKLKENLIGKTFNFFTVIEELGNGRVKAKCVCGTVKELDKYQLKTGRVKSCGCKTAELKSEAFTNNLVGKTINDWTIVEELGAGLVNARCACGKTCKIQKASIINGTSKSCGHSTNAFIDLTGKQFGNWIVLQELGYGRVKVQCQCKNKTIQVVQKQSLINGLTKSCGCQKTQLMQTTLLDKYGDITANRTSNPHESWQIAALLNKENLSNYIKTHYSKKPTIKELVKDLNTQEAQIGRKINTYGLTDLIEYNHEHSSYEDELREYINSIYKGKIEYNKRNIIPPKEIDIYIPDKKIAIEFNGTYWHSALFRDKFYHQQKTIECGKQNIRFIHIFEYEWLDSNKKEKLKEYIKRLLDNSQNKVIQGRNTEVHDISNQEAVDFCNKYHLQDSVNSSINIGLFYNSELVGVMTFGSPRFNTNYQYEIYRLCFKADTVVIGGAEKLFKYFLSNYNPQSIITYADISKFTGLVYLRLGFNLIKPNHITEPNYYWVSLDRKLIVLDRYNTQKHRLVEKGLGTADQSERDIMESYNFAQIFDCGNLRLEWRANKQ